MRIAVVLGFVSALIAAPPSADAISRYEVTADRDYGRNYKTGVDRLGVFVSNRPGGLYMGRLFTGDAFSADGTKYQSPKGVTYFRAKALGDLSACAWVGPSGRVDDTAPWATAAGASTASCETSVVSWLGGDRATFNDGQALYSKINCPPPSTDGASTLGTFGGYTFTNKSTPVYYNLEWRWDGVQYDAAAAREQIGEIPIGTGVFYRYTTKNGKFASVFFDGNSSSYGWAFINADAVTPVDYWSPASDPPNYRRFDCTSRTTPASDVPRPWTLWLALGGQVVAPQA